MTRIARLALFIVSISGVFTLAPSVVRRNNRSIVLVSPLAKSASAQTISPSATFGQLVNDTKEFLPTPTPSKATDKIDKPINILLLGLDARKGDKNPRCDAIHMLSFDSEKGKVLITTVPRGTSVEIPGVEKQSRYLGNSCHLVGINFAVAKIENITGIRPDHIVKVEFSETLGILRLFGLPTTPTLQFLRSRRYPRGDYQRGRNQALFIKDMIISKLSQFTQLPKPLQYLAFKMVDTDIDFEKAISLLHQMLESGAHKDPNRIELLTKPSLSFPLKELHFPEEQFQNQSIWQDDGEFINYQDNLEQYLQNLITRAEKIYQANKASQAFNLINTPFHQQLWLQIENSEKRNRIHFDLLRLFVLTSPDRNNIASFVLDFITEMETIHQAELKREAEELLEEISL